MKRTAILATLLLVVCPSRSVAADPVTFLVAFTRDSSRLVVASHRGGIKVLSIPDLKETRSFSFEGDHGLNGLVLRGVNGVPADIGADIHEDAQ